MRTQLLVIALALACRFGEAHQTGPYTDLPWIDVPTTDFTIPLSDDAPSTPTPGGNDDNVVVPTGKQRPLLEGSKAGGEKTLGYNTDPNLNKDQLTPYQTGAHVKGDGTSADVTAKSQVNQDGIVKSVSLMKSDQTMQTLKDPVVIGNDGSSQPLSKEMMNAIARGQASATVRDASGNQVSLGKSESQCKS